MFKKMFASVGIGGAKVNTTILTENLYPGCEFDIQIDIEGGSTEQNIEDINLSLMCESDYEVEDFDGDEYEGAEYHSLQEWQIPINSQIAPNEEISHTITLTLDLEAPVTVDIGGRNYSKVWLQTGMEIDNALDDTDRDFLFIHPTPLQAAFLNAMIESGYQLHKIDIESGDISNQEFESKFNFYQEFEFRLDHSGFFGIQEVELSFVAGEDSTGIYVQVDRKFSSDRNLAFTVDSNLDDEMTAIQIMNDVLS